MKNFQKEEDFMFNFIDEICKSIGGRLAFSEKEKEGAEFIKNEFKKYCDETLIEKFSARTGPFQLDFRVSVISYIISVLIYFVIPWISLILMSFCITTILCMNIWNIRILYLFGSVKESQNVIGRIKPKTEIKKIIIFGSHVDSANELTLVHKFQYKFIYFVIIGLFLMIFVVVISIIKLAIGLFQFVIIGFDLFGLISIFGILGVFPLYFMVNYKIIVEGANDNLSGVAICLNLMRKFKQDPPNNVELRFIAFGAEEGGRIGSNAYVKRHEKELSNSYTINFDTVGGKGPGKLVIIRKEVTVPHSEEVINLLSEAAKKAGHPMDYISIPLAGGTDSWAFSKRGLKASAIYTKAETIVPKGWHVREDTPDIIDKKKLKICSDVGAQFVRIIDESLNS
ncbi:MAG: M28 family metallopeptidase [Candidatus Helarchaeota archaeon]